MKNLWRFSVFVVLFLILFLMFINVIQVDHSQIGDKKKAASDLQPEFQSKQQVNNTRSLPATATEQSEIVKGNFKPLQQRKDPRPFNMSSVRIIGNDIGQEAEVPTETKYIFFVPHSLSGILPLQQLREEDIVTVQKLVNFLELFPKFDAATGLPHSSGSLNKTLCSYQVYKNTLVLRNTGNVFTTNVLPVSLTYQECNIVDTAFLMRKKEFFSYEFQNKYGIVSMTEFFIRYQRSIKIAKLENLFLSSALNYKDRGILEKEIPYQDYFLFGSKTKILRIINPDKITWTQCSTSETLCHERPLTKRNGPDIVLPVCCNEVLDEMLRDFSTALEQLKKKYLVSHGTLLGAVRHNAIIPWTRDVDLALLKKDMKDKKIYEELRAILKDKYFIGYYELQDRALPHFMPTVTVNTKEFFAGTEDKKGKEEILYSKRVLSEMNKMFPIRKSWLSYVYLDFYEEQNSQMSNTSTVIINGRNYPTYRDPVAHLKILYGENYATPVKE